MKKKITIILFILLCTFFVIGLFQTFATNATVATNDDNIYNINVTEGETVEVPAKSSKNVIYHIFNTNKGVVQYGVGYTTSNTDIVVKYWWDSIDPASGTFDYGDNKFIKLKITNHSNTDASITLNTVLGYENGGELIPSSNTTLVTGMINEYNFLKNYIDKYGSNQGMYLGGVLSKDYVGTVTFVDDNIVPSGSNYKSFDVSKEGDGSIILWYYDDGGEVTNGKYDVYVGSDNGRSSIETGYRFFYSFEYTTLFDLTYFETSNVTSMENMFEYCGSVTDLDLGSFNTSNVITMYGMFSFCSSLTNLNVSSFDTSNVTNMVSMYNSCSSLVNLDLSSFYTPKLVNVAGMFRDCTSLSTIDMTSMYFQGLSEKKYYANILLDVPKSVKIYIPSSEWSWWSANIRKNYGYSASS